MGFFALDYDVVDSGSVSSPLSNSGTGTIRPVNFSDEEVMLASSCPKKRAGRKKFRETRHPVYRGVRRKNSGKWVCEVREPSKKSRIWLGTFPTPEMAARAHNVAAIALRGRSACLNFADSAWTLPVPASTDPKDIQKAATEAFRSTEHWDENSGDNARSNEKKEGVEMTVSENEYYLDEEEVFGTQSFLANMAAGMMMSPPRCGYNGDEQEYNAADDFIPLWNHC
ncbi:Dehydration-responsive element-binding protein 1B [Hibiscus syriacus]|uniref:Dehydration-responsive element-binding protein 1B n=1 Tax=Hibiscus syriacus TaxID=106335 RepID=A0A6A2YS84_HIBSY|nr:dehydration-responsive element-binding protein 1D-like [Hibiscus syriacus]KAE8682338.1 Dehydration-responsive element-binding protein 1B [Hibiscus syriacus]